MIAFFVFTMNSWGFGMELVYYVLTLSTTVMAHTVVAQTAYGHGGTSPRGWHVTARAKAATKVQSFASPAAVSAKCHIGEVHQSVRRSTSTIAFRILSLKQN